MSKPLLPIAMITDENFILPTCVAIISLQHNMTADSQYEVNVLMAECSEQGEQTIVSLSKERCPVKVIRVSLEKYSSIKQLAHISRACLLKFDICDLFPQYDKILYLDGDIIVRGDLYELFDTDLGDTYAAGVKELDCMMEDKKNVNAGIMVFNAKKLRDEHLRDKLVETRISLGDRGSMDQQTFNIVTGKNYTYLPIRYNCVPGKLIGKEKYPQYTTERLNQLYGCWYENNEQVVENALILHFATSNKPWNYTFGACAKEWFEYYKLSPYKKADIKRRGRWGYRVSKMKQAWKRDGLKGCMERVKSHFQRQSQKNGDHVEWE